MTSETGKSVLPALLAIFDQADSFCREQQKTIKELRAMLSTQDAQIGRLNNEIVGRNLRIKELDIDIIRLQQEVEHLEKSLTNASARILKVEAETKHLNDMLNFWLLSYILNCRRTLRNFLQKITRWL